VVVCQPGDARDLVLAREAAEVTHVEPSPRRGGFIGHLDGTASVAGRPCVVGRGTVLAKRAAGRSG
jgi:hypothetical protein